MGAFTGILTRQLRTLQRCIAARTYIEHFPESSALHLSHPHRKKITSTQSQKSKLKKNLNTARVAFWHGVERRANATLETQNDFLMKTGIEERIQRRGLETHRHPKERTSNHPRKPQMHLASWSCKRHLSQLSPCTFYVFCHNTYVLRIPRALDGWNVISKGGENGYYDRKVGLSLDMCHFLLIFDKTAMHIVYRRCTLNRCQTDRHKHPRSK